MCTAFEHRKTLNPQWGTLAWKVVGDSSESSQLETVTPFLRLQLVPPTGTDTTIMAPLTLCTSVHANNEHLQQVYEGHGTRHRLEPSPGRTQVGLPSLKHWKKKKV